MPWSDVLADGGPLFQVMRFTRVRCSGLCCGNPRRHFGGVTRQEQRADDRMCEELTEIWRAQFARAAVAVEVLSVPLSLHIKEQKANREAAG